MITYQFVHHQRFNHKTSMQLTLYRLSRVYLGIYKCVYAYTYMPTATVNIKDDMNLKESKENSEEERRQRNDVIML